MISHNPFLSTKRGVHSPYTFPDPLAPEFLKLRHFTRNSNNGNQRITAKGNLHQFLLSHAVPLQSILYIPPFSKEFSLLFFLQDLSTATTGIIQGVLKLAFRDYTHFPGQENPHFFTTAHQQEVTNEEV
jgi:hypothetical protein